MELKMQTIDTSPEKYLEQNVHRTNKITGIGVITFEEAMEIIRLTRLESDLKVKEELKKSAQLKEKLLSIVTNADVYLKTNDGRELICKKNVSSLIEQVKIQRI